MWPWETVVIKNDDLQFNTYQQVEKTDTDTQKEEEADVKLIMPCHDLGVGDS